MIWSVRSLLEDLTLIGVFIVGVQASAQALAWNSHAWAASSPASADGKPDGDPDRGRSVFNGVGGCSNCHGYDGDMTRRPPFPPKLADELARLTPPPADLRNPASLKSENEEQRFLAVKFGHPRTAMFPKKFLTDQEIRHILAYLAALRTGSSDEGQSRTKK